MALSGYLPQLDGQDPQEECDILGDEGDDTSSGHQASTPSEHKRVQNSLFDKYCLDHANEIPAIAGVQGYTVHATDEDFSLYSLMSREESRQIIKNPREYQIELFERAKEQNTIAVLDTGSGKTLIAVLLLRHVIDQELEDRAAGKTPRISFFLVTSVTLVFQQYAVLECNLDHGIARFCGAMKCDLWSRDTWVQQFEENKVIVCTADILLQCLMHSYITMKQINLLIFDEAHHAKKNHSYARIIKDHYLPERDIRCRPRIFGLTASPVDAKVDVVQAALELETLLSCKIATTSDMSTVSKAVSKPIEQVLRYSRLQKPFETALHQDLKAHFGNILIFDDIFARAEDISSNLGRWCADAYLQSAFVEDRSRKTDTRLSRRFNSRSVVGPVEELDGQLAELRRASDMAAKYSLPMPSVTLHDLSSKVLELQRWLAMYFSRPSDHRCIVFVDRRHTACLMWRIFQHIGGQHLKPCFLTGAKNSNADEDNLSFRQQVLTLIKFRRGEVNCLFATSVAEEGLDVPDCNLVVRFDMYKTMIQYVQSRGRARHPDSKFLHMIEAGNTVQEQLMQEVRYCEHVMRSFCRSLPEDRRLTGNEDELESLLAEEKYMRVYTEPLTGAKLTYGNALAILARFVSTIPTESDEIQQPNYIFSSKGGRYICEVVLAANAPVQRDIGLVCTKKMLAKRSAAFSICLKLREGNYLDDRLLPTYQKRLPALRNAALAKGMNKTDTYSMRVKPAIWEAGRGTVPMELHVLVIDFPSGLDRPHRPVALLTRRAMLEFPRFPLFLISKKRTDVVSTPMKGTISVTKKDMGRLTAFMLRMFKDIFNKTYQQGEDEKMSYWLAPLANGASPDTLSPRDMLDWPTINKVANNEECKWNPDMPDEFLVDRFLVDPWDGSLRYFSKGVDPTLKALDPVPQDTAKRRQSKNILDYSSSLFKKAREAAKWNLDQPVVETERLLARRNMLAMPEMKEISSCTKAFVCPEPLRISALPCDVVATCAAIPAIMWRLDSYLVALEACQLVGIDCDLALSLEAVTKDSESSDVYEERTNFQSGMGSNYERLEFMGDCFLKMATSISVFIQNPNDSEFEFHVRRMLMICNQNMFNVGTELGIHEYIRTTAFSRRLWYPRGITLLEGKGVNSEGSEETKHSLGKKTIADVSEALIGAAVATHYKPGAWKAEQWEYAIRAVTKLVKSDDHKMQVWSDYSATYKLPAYQIAECTASQRDLAEKVEREHSYHFRYPRLLRSAFQHPGYPFLWERLPSYQRLEFLGDSLLDMTAITHIFYRYPHAEPQWMTEHKMAMVSNKFLAALCAKIGFYRHLRYTSAALEHQVREYVAEIEELERLSNGRPDYWDALLMPPKCMSDIVEAYVGAIFIDSDFDYAVVQDFFDQHIRPYFENMSLYDRYANNHPVTHLISMLRQQYGCERFGFMSKELPDVKGTKNGAGAQVVSAVMIHHNIVVEGRGKSARYGRIRVARQAHEMIKDLALHEFKARFGCDCKTENHEVVGVMESGDGKEVVLAESGT